MSPARGTSAARQPRRADRWLRASLAAGAVPVVAAFLLTLFGGPELPGAVAVLGGLALLAAPAAALALRSTLARASVPALLVGAAWCAQLVPLALLGWGTAGALLLGVLLLAYLNLYLHRANDAAAAAALVLSPVATVVGFSVAPGAVWLILFPLALGLGATSLLALQARRAELLAWRRPGDYEEPPSGRRLLAYAAPLTALVLLATLLVYVAVLVLPEPILQEGESVESPTEPESELASSGTQEDQDSLDTFEQIFPSGMDLSGGITQLQRETVMRIAPTGGVDIGPLYMRGMVLDVIDDQGATFQRTSGRVTEEPEPDGWADLGRPFGRAALLEISVEQQPMLIRRGNLGILFAPERLLAIDLTPIQHDPDGLLVALEPDPDWFRFRARFQDRRASYLDLSDRRALHGEPLYTELAFHPRSADELAQLERIAREVVAAANNDVERVNALVGWFQSEFTYSLDVTEFPGLPGVLEFLRRRSGPCTYYASAATLMLRSLGIPARIATGFLAKEFDSEERSYEVTTREGHAWIEVHFEGVGWVTFDPTPGGQRARALAQALEAEGEPGVGSLARDLAGSLKRWAESGGDVAEMREFVSTLAEAPRAVWGSLKRSPLIALGLAGVLVAALLLRRFGARAGGERVAPAAVDARVESLYRKLLTALARRGHRRRPPQTLREFAASVRLAGGERYRPLPAIAEAFYGARFGGRELSPADEEAVRGFLRSLDDAD
ncbi:MAG: transglutaminase domain-containing protein [Planctomycetota bacterium]